MRDVWFPFAAPNPNSRLRLFCFPYAGGGATVFREWSAQLAPSVEVYAIQPPGRETRFMEVPLRRVEDLAAAAVPAVEWHLREPFAFFGYSLGAFVAFEVACELKRRSRRQPERLVVGGARAPHLLRKLPPLHGLRGGALREALLNLEGTPLAVLKNEEMMTLLEPLLRADLEMAETYVAQAAEPLDCPISVFGGIEDPEVSQDQLAAWQQLSTSLTHLRMFPGGHFFFREHAVDFVRVLRQELEQHGRSASGRTTERTP